MASAARVGARVAVAVAVAWRCGAVRARRWCSFVAFSRESTYLSSCSWNSISAWAFCDSFSEGMIFEHSIFICTIHERTGDVLGVCTGVGERRRKQEAVGRGGV